jgi:hypothetical protein
MISGMMLCVLMLAVSGCLGMMLAHRFMLMLLLKGQADERHFLRNRANQFRLCLPVPCGDVGQDCLGAVMDHAERVREYYRRQGEVKERARLIALLKEQKVIRNCAATDLLVFVNCNTLEVLYLEDDLMNESAK